MKNCHFFRCLFRKFRCITECCILQFISYFEFLSTGVACLSPHCVSVLVSSCNRKSRLYLFRLRKCLSIRLLHGKIGCKMHFGIFFPLKFVHRPTKNCRYSKVYLFFFLLLFIKQQSLCEHLNVILAERTKMHWNGLAKEKKMCLCDTLNLCNCICWHSHVKSENGQLTPNQKENYVCS